MRSTDISEKTAPVTFLVDAKLTGLEVYDPIMLRIMLNRRRIELGIGISDPQFSRRITLFLKGQNPYLSFPSLIDALQRLKLQPETLERCVRPVYAPKESRYARTDWPGKTCRTGNVGTCKDRMTFQAAIRTLSDWPLEAIRNALIRELLSRMSLAAAAVQMGVSRRSLYNWTKEIGVEGHEDDNVGCDNDSNLPERSVPGGGPRLQDAGRDGGG